MSSFQLGFLWQHWLSKPRGPYGEAGEVDPVHHLQVFILVIIFYENLLNLLHKRLFLAKDIFLHFLCFNYISRVLIFEFVLLLLLLVFVELWVEEELVLRHERRLRQLLGRILFILLVEIAIIQSRLIMLTWHADLVKLVYLSLPYFGRLRIAGLIFVLVGEQVSLHLIR